MIIDYKVLNEKRQAYPLPNITEILDQLKRMKYFSIFDLAFSFHQIPIYESEPKTIFITSHRHYLVP